MTQTLEQVMEMIVEKYGKMVEVTFKADLSGYIFDPVKAEYVFVWSVFSDLIVDLLP